MTYCIEGRTYQLAPGDIVLVNAGEVPTNPRSTRIFPTSASFYMSPRIFLRSTPGKTAISPSALSRRTASRHTSSVCRIPRGGRLGASIRALDASLNDDDYAAALHHRLLFLEFMIQLNRAALHHHIEFVGDSASNEKILSILTYLNAHLTEDLSIDDLASRFYLSRSYLMHTFKAQTGYTIGGYLLTKRLFLAKELIAAGTPITEVCYSCGFQELLDLLESIQKLWGIPEGLPPKPLSYVHRASYARSDISFMSVGIICFLREIMPSNRMPSASSCFLNACARIFQHPPPQI